LAAGPFVRGERALGIRRRPNGIVGAPEGDKERVTLRVHLVAVMPVECLAQETPVSLERLRVSVAELLRAASTLRCP